ncbi:MAG: glycosyltransferase [Nanoarchaeota archaeon]|nr:glycosyltransferase [Nanoarchaeota archaeon]MBU0963133.1 glycosyltransferase [Nanoarchaeota archaeon]
MKIAMFTDTFIPNINGIVTSILNSSEALAKRDHKIYIFTAKPKQKEYITKDLSNNISVFYHRRIKIVNYPDFQLAMPGFIDTITKIKKIKPDIIHIHTPSFLGWSALLAAKIFKIPVVGTYHTLLPEFTEYLPLLRFNKNLAKKLIWNYTKKFYNLCDVITTPSTAMKKELINNNIKKPIHFLSNGVDINKFHPIKIKKNKNTIIHVGRIGYEKSIDVLLKAFKELLNINRNAKLVIAGNGPDLEKLKSFSKELEINKNVKFLGSVNHSKLPFLYCSAEIFVTASTIETEGLVVLEAMACGLSIIGVNSMAIPNIVKNNKNGFISKPGDYKIMAKNINRLLNNKELNHKFSDNSLKLVQNYSLTSVIDKLERLYSSFN